VDDGERVVAIEAFAEADSEGNGNSVPPPVDSGSETPPAGSNGKGLN
jgi:hypothetical protein